MAGMAEPVVSAVITVLVEKISDEVMSFARSEGIDSQLNKLKVRLHLIQEVLTDAGQKQITDMAVELWLHMLHDLGYDIDDVLDEMATEAMRRKLNQELHASTSTGKVMKMIPACCTNFTPRNIMYGRHMSSKLDELTTKLQLLAVQKNNLGLDVNPVGDGSIEAYNQEVLPFDKAFSLFAQHSVGELNFNKHPRLEELSKRIVEECHGFPLALIMIGRVLKTKRKEDDWEKLLFSELWYGKNDILSTLRKHCNLPPHLKRLFAYYSLFPKDYKFDKNEMVLLWMAEGILFKSNGKSMESFGHDLFKEPKSRFFFQHSTGDNSRYTMHDFLIDLATSSHGGEFFFLLDDETNADKRNEALEKFRHFSFIGHSYGMFKETQRARCLRTFLRMPHATFSNVDLVELLPQLQFLRVLSLAHSEITEVPQSISDLKHMRYLNFSHTKITCLPEQVSELYNLQSLLVSHCQELCSLPVSFAKLKNLRHLDISDTPELKKMPLGIGGLLSLQTLSRVIIEGPDNGFKISELKDLSNLQGRLTIEGLRNVTNAGEAKEANLQGKEGIDEIVLQWSDVFDGSRDEKIDYEVLKELRPHCKLKKLEINFYGGKELPNWAESPPFDRLTRCTLRGCRNLVSFGDSMESVEKVCIVECDKLEEYECSNNVKRLEISYCGSMTSFFSSKESLKEVCIKGCYKLKNCYRLNSVERLEVVSCPSMTSFFGSMESLKEVCIKGCDEFEYYYCPKNVERFEIVDCESLTSLTFSSEPSSSLKYLRIYNC